jgi:hypothetical protein
MSLTKRSAAALASVVGALAIAAPITTAGAATTPAAYPGFDLSAWASLWGFGGVPLSFVGPSGACVCFAKGPTVIDDVFNGGTTVVVSDGPAYGTVVGSP